MKITDEMVEAARRSLYFSADSEATEAQYIEDCKDDDAEDVAKWVRAALEAAMGVGEGVPACPECSVPLLFECPGCSNTNYPQPPTGLRTKVGEGDVDRLAQIIRKVNGNNSMGAGALAEAIISEWMKPSDKR